ncbi:U3 small nucleolar RNA-associated protein 4 [Colletotrichum sp. SAR 10_66]|nr:U3 small nucleolar RNA-associated protein 4 [Colletotrichum sp. SAR 10_76]KAJ4994696.1 U3 small nucleolar RNA-associated protein 4 [Colletotrichum sp. SAR 10_66]
MELHRCRFIAYPPSAINALAFSHPSARTKQHSALSRLAVGRANGDIEIWNPLNGAWLQETVLRSGADRSVDGLVWVTDPDDTPSAPGAATIPGRARLFSIGYTSAVTEWNLETGRPLRHASGQHGDIWCLAAQPPASPSDPVTRLVAGTIDGVLALYSVEDGELRFQRILVKSPTKKVQMVSIAFQSRHTFVVGCSDSTLRVYDIKRGSCLSKMTIGPEKDRKDAGARERADIIVWSVKTLPSGDIVSADSAGQVCIWDGKTYTQAQRIQGHRQDALSLATSADGSAIMSGGMDRRTVLYKKTSGNGARWGKVWSRKYHEHDVKAMASFESRSVSIVVTGGPDASPVVLPLKELGRENHRTLPHLPQTPPLASAPDARLLINWWDNQVEVWKLQNSFDGLFGDGVAPADKDKDLDANRKLLKTILVNGDSSISSAAITPDGSLCAVATPTALKAFHLRHDGNPTKPSDVAVSTIPVPASFASNGASKVILSPDGAWLAAVQDGSKVLVARITRDADSGAVAIEKPRAVARLRRNVPKHQSHGGLGSYERTVAHLAFSPDSRMLAAADLAGYIDTWVFGTPSPRAEDDEEEDSASDSDSDDAPADAATERWIRNPTASLLPKLPATPVVLSFSPDLATTPNNTPEYTLAAVTTAWHILIFNPAAGSLNAWSRRNPVSRLPATIRETRDLAKGALWQGPRVWIYGINFLFMLDLSQDLSAPVAVADPDTAVVVHAHAAGTKRKRKGPDSGAGSKMSIGAIVPAQVDRFVAAKGTKEWQDDIESRAPADAMDVDSDADSADDVAAAGSDSEEPESGLATLRGRQEETQAEDGAGKTRWWHTYKYRPILGIAPLSGTGAASLEAVLVERPLWEVDLPERYFGADEWER